MLLRSKPLEIEIGRVGLYLRLGRLFAAHWSRMTGATLDGPKGLRLDAQPSR